MSSVATRQDERGRRSPGHGAEPRRLAWNRTHRRGPSRRPAHRLYDPHCREPGALGARAHPAPGATEQGIEIVTTEQAHAAAVSAGLTPAEADAVTADYADAQLEALKKAMLAVALLAFLSFMFTRNLPARRLSVSLTPPARGERGQVARDPGWAQPLAVTQLRGCSWAHGGVRCSLCGASDLWAQRRRRIGGVDWPSRLGDRSGGALPGARRCAIGSGSAVSNPARGARRVRSKRRGRRSPSHRGRGH